MHFRIQQRRACTLRFSFSAVALAAVTATTLAFAQTNADQSDFRIALTTRPGQLHWHADGFKIVEYSAKPNGEEIGIRGRNDSGSLTFLGFLFVVPGQAQLTGTRCRDGALDALKRGAPGVKILATSEMQRSGSSSIAIANYSGQDRAGKALYSIRSFVASGVLCGDLEVYGDTPTRPDDPEIKKILDSYGLDTSYKPQPNDILLYAQILYEHRNYAAAAPIFEQLLASLNDSQNQQTMKRVATDQAGIAYGISGNTAKARAIFEKAIATDPDYPMYYYNLACADAQEHKLAEARSHLQQAFARKGNVIRGEKMPDPSKDDSFLPYQNDRDFWKFVEGLR